MPARRSRRVIHRWEKTVSTICSNRLHGWSSRSGRPRRYFVTSRAAPQTKMVVEMTIRPYQAMISGRLRPMKTWRVAGTAGQKSLSSSSATENRSNTAP